MPNLLIVRRDKVGLFRKVQVFLDDVIVARLRLHDEASIEVPPGEHVLYAKQDNTESIPITVGLEEASPQTIVRVGVPWTALVFFEWLWNPKGALRCEVLEPTSVRWS